MALPFFLYQQMLTANYKIPVQKYYPGIDYTKGSSQLLSLTIPNVRVGDVLEADGAIDVSWNGLPYGCVIGATITWDGSFWGDEGAGEDVQPTWRDYYRPTLHVIRVSPVAGSVVCAMRIYAGSAGNVQAGDAVQTIIANGKPLGHLWVRRWPA